MKRGEYPAGWQFSAEDMHETSIRQRTDRERIQREAYSSARMLAFGVLGVIVAGAVIVFWAVLAR